MLIQYALDKELLNNFISKASPRIICTIRHDIGDLLWFWMGNPTIERIEEIKQSYPYLEKFVDFDIILKRLNHLDKFKKNEADFENIFGIHISKIFPELEELKQIFANIIDEIPNGVKKAELLLYPIAIDAGANADMEAAIYFASQGEILLDPIDIKKEWHRNICLDIERGRPVGKISTDVIERAKSKNISLSEASEILKFNDDLPRFFGFRDDEENFIDSTFLRATEWFDVKGFEPWINSVLNKLSSASQYGIDHVNDAWSLFYWCRSDLAINKTDKFGLESLLYGLINGTIEKNQPWKTTRHSQKTFEYVDYIPIASSITFSWYRIKPINLKSEVLEKAIEFLFQTQLNNGGWPITSKESEGSIISTCFAIHALALSKPSGWEKIVNKAKEWLLKEQSKSGCWHIQGVPTIMLTVLALESIHLASGGDNVSFSINKSKEKKTSQSKNVDNTDYDYSNEDWYKKEITEMVSKAKNDVIKIFFPKIAIITAVEIELQAVLKRLRPPKGKRKLWKIIDGSETYYLGRFGEFDTVVSMCNMGTIGASGATLAVDSLVRTWNPIGIIMVGIAFGANKTKQKIGDVLVASNIIPYEYQRVGDKTIYRSPVVPSSHELINRIRNTFDWDFKRPDNTKVDKHIGHILSGEKLIDNIEFKNELLEQYPQVIGGEMEGAGLWSAAEKNKKSWILIKSICDWGDGNKYDNYQPLAAAAAVSLCEYVFNEKHTLDGMK